MRDRFGDKIYVHKHSQPNKGYIISDARLTRNFLIENYVLCGPAAETLEITESDVLPYQQFQREVEISKQKEHITKLVTGYLRQAKGLKLCEVGTPDFSNETARRNIPHELLHLVERFIGLHNPDVSISAQQIARRKRIALSVVQIMQYGFSGGKSIPPMHLSIAEYCHFKF